MVNLSHSPNEYDGDRALKVLRVESVSTIMQKFKISEEEAKIKLEKYIRTGYLDYPTPVKGDLGNKPLKETK